MGQKLADIKLWRKGLEMGCSGQQELRQSPWYWYLCLASKMPNRDNLREERFISATGFRVISVCSGEGKPVGHEAVDVHIKRIQKQRLQMEPRYNFKSTYSTLKNHDGF